MKKSRYSDSQIMATLKLAETGTPIPELCREHGMSSATFYRWRAKYGGMDASLMKRMKDLEAENRRLKKMYAEERLKAEVIQEAMEKSGEIISSPRDGQTQRFNSSHRHSTGMPVFSNQSGLLLPPAQTA